MSDPSGPMSKPIPRPATRCVYPVEDLREHITDSSSSGGSCWCGPKVTQICPFCWDDKGMKADCGYCEGAGWLPVYTSDPDCPTVIVHNAADGRE
jgi:hypothetical protein